MEKKVSNLDRERKEESLRKVAERARESRIGVRSAPNEGMVNYVALTTLISNPPFLSPQSKTLRHKRGSSSDTIVTRRGRGSDV